ENPYRRDMDRPRFDAFQRQFQSGQPVADGEVMLDIVGGTDRGQRPCIGGADGLEQARHLRFRVRHFSLPIQTRSIAMATPCPTPTHKVISAVFSLRSSSARRAVKASLAPEAPRG